MEDLLEKMKLVVTIVSFCIPLLFCIWFVSYTTHLYIEYLDSVAIDPKYNLLISSIISIIAMVIVAYKIASSFKLRLETKYLYADDLFDEDLVEENNDDEENKNNKQKEQ